MNAQQLKNSILQEAIEGRLVPQDPNDEPVSVLLDKIRKEKEMLVKEGKLKKKDLIETPISEDEIPFKIPESWLWCRLNDICIFLSRGKSPSYSDIPNEYPVFAQKCNLKDGGISLEQARFLNPETVSKWSNEYHLHTDDVLINSTGTGTVCRTRLFHESYLGHYQFTVPDSHVSVARTSSRICSAYIFNLFNSKFYQEYWEDRLAGSTNQKELYIGVLQNTIIPLPPLAEQHRIVEKIEELMPKVEEYGKAQEALDKLNTELPEQLKKSILQEAIEGRLVPQDPNDEPASVLLDKIRKEKEKLVKKGKLKKKDLQEAPISEDEIPFKIPKSWEWASIGYIANLYTGNSISKNIKETKYTNVKGRWYIATKDVSFDNIIDYDNGVYIPEKDENLFKIATAGSILMCIEGGSAGRKICITDRDVCFGNKLCCFKSYGILNSFLFYYLQSSIFKRLFNNNKKGIIGGVSINMMSPLLIPLPPLAEQHRIAEKIEELLRKIENIKETNKEIKSK